MAYKIDVDFTSSGTAGLTNATPHCTITIAGNYDLSITSLVAGGNGSYHTAGFALATEDQVYFKWNLSNTASAQTSGNLGIVRNAATLTSQGYSLNIASGTVAGTSFAASGSFQDRAVDALTDYWFKYVFKATGNIEAYIKGGAYTDWTGVRDMAAGFTTGTIRPQIDFIGISPNDGTDHLIVSRIVAADSAGPDPSVGGGGNVSPANSNFDIFSVSGTSMAIFRRRKGD